MKFYAKTVDGRIVNSLTLQDGVAVPAGFIEVAGPCDPFLHYISNGTVVAYTDVERDRLSSPPNFPAQWDAATKQWADSRSLDVLKTVKWKAIKAAAHAAAIGSFVAAGFNWDSDLETQQALSVTIQDMTTGDTTVWYTAEGAAKTLTFAQMKALGRAMRNHLQAQQAKAATLRTQIAAATTKAELDAITW
jgi:hypothetical protein